MLVTASIVTYKTNKDELSRCLNSLVVNGVNKIYIIDNSPTNCLQDVCVGDSVEYIFNNKNLGYGTAHNIAIRKSIALNSNYHLVLNSDVHIESNVVSDLVEYMESDQNIAQVIPKIVLPDGSLQYSCRLLPSPLDLFARRFMSEEVAERRNYNYLMKFADHNSPMNVPYHLGCFMLFRIKCLKEEGLFDERFFMYPEDIDITRRMHRKYKTMYFPNVSIIHEHRAESYKTVRMMWVHICNMVKYFNKWGWIFDKERKIWNDECINMYGGSSR